MIKDTTGIDLPPPPRKTIDAEGSLIVDAVRKAVREPAGGACRFGQCHSCLPARRRASFEQTGIRIRASSSQTSWGDRSGGRHATVMLDFGSEWQSNSSGFRKICRVLRCFRSSYYKRAEDLPDYFWFINDSERWLLAICHTRGVMTRPAEANVSRRCWSRLRHLRCRHHSSASGQGICSNVCHDYTVGGPRSMSGYGRNGPTCSGRSPKR